MILAEQKKSESIAEYILYVWQMEDLVRAADFNIDVIRHFVSEGLGEDNELEEEVQWFASLIRQMKGQRIEKKGHVADLYDLIGELQYLHNSLITVFDDKVYKTLHEEAKPNMEAFSEKSTEQNISEVETYLSALYGLLTLRLKGQQISRETEEAMKTFGALMAKLSVRYRQMKSGTLEINPN